jgi:hypothetical protein
VRTPVGKHEEIKLDAASIVLAVPLTQLDRQSRRRRRGCLAAVLGIVVQVESIAKAEELAAPFCRVGTPRATAGLPIAATDIAAGAAVL